MKKTKTIRIICAGLSVLLLLLTACGSDPNSISVSYLYPSTVSTAAPTGDLPEYAAQEVTLPYV
ncbi:MAG: hypothetical protein IJC25_07620, partial [Clostridia bacterium]|nr:hypothetical protein [Clostridia bacterium]